MDKKFVPEWVKSVVGNKEDCDVCGMVHLDNVECDEITEHSIRVGEPMINWTEGMPFKSLVRDAYEIARRKGWWDQERDIPHCLALIHSEVSEALEEYREYGIGEFKGRRYNRIGNKPEGFAYELADVVIRVADLAGHLEIDLSRAVKEKMDFNATREYRHGNKRA